MVFVYLLFSLSAGFHTGSTRKDRYLKQVFMGEGRSDWSVITIKTHKPPESVPSSRCNPLHSIHDCTLKRVILIIRHPMEASLATYHLTRTKSHVGAVNNLPANSWLPFPISIFNKLSYLNITAAS